MYFRFSQSGSSCQGLLGRGVCPPPRPGTRAPGPGCKEMLLPILLYSSVIEWRKLSFEETLDFI